MTNTKQIYDYFENKYSLGYLGLFKATAMASMFIKNRDVIPLSILCIAPSGQFKSRTTIELTNIFSNKSIIDLGSDFTIHSLIDRFDSGKKCQNKTLSINDLTLLLSSKTQRTKERLVNAMAEVLSEGIYQYGERNKSDLYFKARINIIANITKNSYVQNKKNFLDNTFIERLVPFFYSLTDEQQLAFVKNIEQKKAIAPDSKITLKGTIVNNYIEFNEAMINMSVKYQCISLSPSLPRAMEKIKAILGGLCVINGQSQITDNEIKFCSEFLPFCSDMDSRDISIIIQYKQGVSVDEICKNLGYSSNYPYKVIHKYKEEGILS